MISFFAGLTSQSVDIFIPDSASTTGAGKTGLVFNSAGLTAYYRKGAAGSATAITLATLANAQAAWSSGGFVEIDSTNMPGMYRLDIPNAAIDTAGFTHVELKGATGMAPVLIRFDCRPLPADVRQFGGTAGTFASGRPEVNTTHAAGTAWGSGAITAATIAPSAFDDKGNWLKPTVAGRTLDVSAGGEAGIDWANVGSPTTVLGLTGTTISSSQVVASVTGAVGSVTSLAANSVNASALAADAVTEIQSGLATTTQLNALLTTAMTESYSTDGSAPTPAQALMMILQVCTEKAVSGTTMTVKKLDGSTTAFTLTLNDATNPTSLTRAS